MLSLLAILLFLLMALWRLVRAWRRLWHGIPRSNRDFSPFLTEAGT